MDLLHAVLVDPFVQMAAMPDFFLQVLWEGAGLGHPLRPDSARASS